MTIREVEERVGITSANIRFYEKEGLLSPNRNKENNYREYTQEHVELLKKIKFLRMLGISFPDIRLLIHSEINLSDVVKRRREELKQEEEKIKEIDKLCKYILNEEINFEMIHKLESKKELIALSKHWEYILHGDVSKEHISKNQTNNIIVGMLLWAFLSNACITFCVADFMLSGESGLTKMVWPVIIVSLVSTLGSAWTAKPFIQIVFFQLVSLAWIPFILFAVKLLTDIDFIALIRNGGILIFLILAIAAIILRILACTKYFKQLRIIILVMLGYSAITTIILTHKIRIHGIFTFVFLGVLFVYMSTIWVNANRGEEIINKYYVITTVTGMLNFIGKGMNYQNIGMEKGYGRQELWK